MTISQVLTHEGGVPWISNVSLTSADEWNEQIVGLLAKQQLVDHGGNRIYHSVTRDNVLAEVLRRVTGSDVNTLMQQLCHQLDDECTVVWGWRKFRPELASRVAHSQYAHGPLYAMLRYWLDG